jgi:hypothetical protein
MVSQARMMMGGIAAIAVLAVTVWICMPSMPKHHGTVEIKQLDPASWSVQVTELGAAMDENKTAATAR